MPGQHASLLCSARRPQRGLCAALTTLLVGTGLTIYSEGAGLTTLLRGLCAGMCMDMCVGMRAGTCVDTCGRTPERPPAALGIIQI